MKEKQEEGEGGTERGGEGGRGASHPTARPRPQNMSFEYFPGKFYTDGAEPAVAWSTRIVSEMMRFRMQDEALLMAYHGEGKGLTSSC